jgi:hypothetical protein
MGAEQSTAKVADNDKTTTNSDIETPPVEETKPEEPRPPNSILEQQQQEQKQEQQEQQPDRKTSYQPPTPNTTPILKSEFPTEEVGRKIEVVPADLTDSVDIVRKWVN